MPGIESFFQYFLSILLKFRPLKTITFIKINTCNRVYENNITFATLK